MYVKKYIKINGYKQKSLLCKIFIMLIKAVNIYNILNIFNLDVTKLLFICKPFRRLKFLKKYNLNVIFCREKHTTSTVPNLENQKKKISIIIIFFKTALNFYSQCDYSYLCPGV